MSPYFIYFYSDRPYFLISNNAFYFIWFVLVTDLCVSAQLPLKANIARNLTYPFLHELLLFYV